MFSKYGNTLDSGYMVFTYGGQSHLWIIMDEEVLAFAKALKQSALTTSRNINEVFKETLFNRAETKDEVVSN